MWLSGSVAQWLTVERFFEFSSNESSSLLFSIPLKTEHTTTTTTMVQLIGNFDFGALCLPTVPWGKSTRKMQFFRKVRFYARLSPPRIYRCLPQIFPSGKLLIPRKDVVDVKQPPNAIEFRQRTRSTRKMPSRTF